MKPQKPGESPTSSLPISALPPPPPLFPYSSLTPSCPIPQGLEMEMGWQQGPSQVLWPSQVRWEKSMGLIRLGQH